jgi:lipid-A-disaccharide synthase
MIVAGEASGDLHGSNLVKAALSLDPELVFFGIGGPRMRKEGVNVLVDASAMAVVGLVEVISHAGVIHKSFTLLKRIIRTNPPDLLILIDYPDFNLMLAGVARSAGVKVLYYISPQVWAWRVRRVKKIARLVDRMAVVFPFEVPFYEKEKAPVAFVGHPLVDTVRPTMSVVEAHRIFGTDPFRRTIGLFPGSRKQEVRVHLPLILESAALLKGRFPDLQFILLLASTLDRSDVEPFLHTCGVPVTIVAENGYDVMQVCDAAISVSGTVTLELALMGVPMVIIYKVSPLTYLIGKRLVRVDNIGLCNIVAGERVVQELIQNDARPEKIADELTRIITDPEYSGNMKSKYKKMKGLLGGGGCSEKVAGIMSEMLKK